MDISQITGELETLRNDITFPITKQELLTLAENKQVQAETKQLLSKLPEERFSSMEEIVQKIPFGETVENDLKGKLEGML